MISANSALFSLWKAATLVENQPIGGSDRSVMAAMDVNAEVLRKQIMVSQFMNAVGCTQEQATTTLQSAHWHLEV